MNCAARLRARGLELMDSGTEPTAGIALALHKRFFLAYAIMWHMGQLLSGGGRPSAKDAEDAW